eukprot:COSAG02_NODE_41732_length_391_cov_1.208904_1_plen_116_part_10
MNKMWSPLISPLCDGCFHVTTALSHLSGNEVTVTVTMPRRSTLSELYRNHGSGQRRRSRTTRRVACLPQARAACSVNGQLASKGKQGAILALAVHLVRRSASCGVRVVVVATWRLP